MLLDAIPYAPAVDRFDEAVDHTGAVRPTWRQLAAAFGDTSAASLFERSRQAERLLDAEGAGHLVHELPHDRRSEERAGLIRAGGTPWKLDPLPVVIPADEFELLESAVTQRVAVIEAVLRDLYGDRHLLAAGVIPPSAVFASPGFRPSMVGHSPVGCWLRHAAIDVVRVGTGEWKVVADVVDAPSGFGYALLNRTVQARLMPVTVRRMAAQPVHDHVDALRRALTAAAPSGQRSPRCVVLTEGPRHETYVEHSYLATQLGYHLAEGADVVMRQNRLWLRALDGLEPLDVVYRRISDAALDPIEPRGAAGNGVPGIVWGARRGGVGLANAYGSGLMEGSASHAWLDAASVFLTGDQLRLGHVTAGESLSTMPSFSAGSVDGVTPTSVVVRLQVAIGPEGPVVMHGGVGRVLAEGDDPRLPTANVSKDVWVLGSPAAPRLRLRAASPPQVDFGTSIPRRSADSLFWMGRAAERAEVAARTARVIGARLEQDPGLATLDSAHWSVSAMALARTAGVLDPTESTEQRSISDELDDTVHHTVLSAARNIGALVAEATSVREYLSNTAGRVLGRLMQSRADLNASTDAPDDLDAVLVDLAALAGLAMESTVRGPAWRFLDLGRRIERALAVVGAVEAVLAVHHEGLAFQPVMETVLQANESLVAYRRRYRSDVVLDAVIELLVHEDANPRSLAFQLDRLREHVAALGWSDGVAFVHEASLGSLVHLDGIVVNGRCLAIDDMVVRVRGPLLQLADALVQRWFADPVNPMMVRGR